MNFNKKFKIKMSNNFEGKNELKKMRNSENTQLLGRNVISKINKEIFK